MKRMNLIAIAAVLSVSTGWLCSHAATVTIDPSREYQTIEGFGAHGGQFELYSQYANTSYTNFAHDDLGITMMRVSLPNDGQAYAGGPLSPTNAHFLTDVGVINGFKRFSDVKFIATIFSPPAWMKTNNDINNGGHVLPAMYGALADYFLGYYNAILQQTGVRLYGLSIQNESAFAEPYPSCEYTPAEYRDALKAVGKRFEDAGVDIKLYGAEDMLEAVTSRPYFGTINQDTLAKRLLHAVAVHGYVDGVNPTSGSAVASAWKRVATVAAGMGGKSAWMTETSGFSEDWSGAMNLASNIFAALRYGSLSGWVFLSDYNCTLEGLTCTGSHTLRSLASKNFYRYIRPGAVRINATTPDSATCLVVAFNHKTDRTLSLVVLNSGSAYTLNLSGAGLPAQLTKYTTTASKRCVNEGAVGTTGIAIDGNSVTTLVGSDYAPPVATIRQPSRRVGTLAPSTGMSLRVYGLNGALLGAAESVPAGRETVHIGSPAALVHVVGVTAASTGPACVVTLGRR